MVLVHHKLEYDDEKRNVFSFHLNVSSIDTCRVSADSKFQAAGSAMLKVLSPNLDFVAKLCLKTDLSRIERLSFADRIHSSLTYSGGMLWGVL